MGSDQCGGEMSRVGAYGEISASPHRFQAVAEQGYPPVIAGGEVIEDGFICFQQLTGQRTVYTASTQIYLLHIGHAEVPPRSQCAQAVELPQRRLGVEADDIVGTQGYHVPN